MLFEKKPQSCCSGPGCCSPNTSAKSQPAKPETQPEKPDDQAEKSDKQVEPTGRKLLIDFLYLDLEVCTRCQGTDDSDRWPGHCHGCSGKSV